MRERDSGRRTTFVVILLALALFVMLWLAIDLNTFSSVHGAP